MKIIYLGLIPGGYELILIIFALLLLFGGKKIPELMRGMGKGIKEFNNARASIESEIKDGMRDVEQKEAIKEKQNKNKKNG